MEENKEKIFNRRALFFSLTLLFLIITVIVIFFACSRKEEEYTGYYVFCIDATETKVAYEKYSPKEKGGTGLIEEFLEQMQTEPADMTIKKAIPDNVHIDDYVLDEGGELTLYLDSAYGNYSGVNEILRRAAIVKTLCQVSEVAAVQFYVAGQPLTGSNLDIVGFMTADTFIDNTGGESTYQQNATITMYFSNKSGDSLVEVPVEIIYDSSIPLEQLAIEQLIRGPQTIDGVSGDNVQPTVPKDTTLNKVTVKEHTCYVDFTEEFLEKPDNITAEVAVYSVVNTLIELPDVNKVQFSINGEQELLYNNTIRFGEVFSRNLDIVEQQQ
ncbi:MAG: GerMN domain-containing protein [Lachnospiraceae bacterium]|nr:GerMN domain-containing protein [Lachnospiraceae bacterium]